MSKEQTKQGLGFDLPENDNKDMAIPDPMIATEEPQNTTSEKPDVDTPEEEVEKPKEDVKEKKFENPQARARILEREKRQRDDRIRDLEIELMRVREAMSSIAQKKEEPQEDEPDRSDPLSYLMKKMDRLEKSIEESKKEAAEKVSEISNEKLLSSYDAELRAAVEANKEIMLPAIQHIAMVVERQTMKENPTLKTNEIKKAAAQKVLAMKLQWAREGRNPLEAMLEEAMDYGFNLPEINQTQAQAEPAPAQSGIVKKEQRPSREAKESVTAGLGGVTGAPPQKFTVKSLYTAKNELTSETEHYMKIRQLQNAGVLGRSRTSRAGLPTLAERLPGKVRTI